jgi:DDE superfamily endonuclease
MPELLWRYLTALLYYRTSGSCVALAEALETVSHDRLTRMLQGDWSGQTLLELTCRTLFVWERGYLILDDTVIPKPFATAMESLAWVFSSQEHKPVYGFSLVLLVWTNGTLRIPLGVRLWRKGGASKYQLALELLSYACNRLRCRPEYVLFDAWYPSKALPKRIRDYGWYFVLPPEEEPPVQWSGAPCVSAASLLGSDRLADRRLESLGRQIRRQVLCHQPPDALCCGGTAALSLPLPSRGSH